MYPTIQRPEWVPLDHKADAPAPDGTPLLVAHRRSGARNGRSEGGLEWTLSLRDTGAARCPTPRQSRGPVAARLRPMVLLCNGGRVRILIAMSRMITIRIALPSRTAWAALRLADRCLADRIEPEENQFFVTATGMELAGDATLRGHFAQLIAASPGLCDLVADELREQSLQDFDVLQLVILHDAAASLRPSDPEADSLRANQLLAG